MPSSHGSRRSGDQPARLAYRKGEAAAALGVSEDFFATIAHEIPCVRRGRVTLFAASDLRDWLEENAERVFDDLDGYLRAAA